MNQPSPQQVERIFQALARGDYHQFLTNCSEDLVVATRGLDPDVAAFDKTSLSRWFATNPSTLGTSVEVTVEIVRVVDSTAIVLLRFSWEYLADMIGFELVNICSFTGGLMSKWSSYPLDLLEYAHFLATARRAALQPA